MANVARYRCSWSSWLRATRKLPREVFGSPAMMSGFWADDGARERVADHLHVGVRGADGGVGGVPVLGGLGVHDGLGLEHVVGHEAR